MQTCILQLGISLHSCLKRVARRSREFFFLVYFYRTSTSNRPSVFCRSDNNNIRLTFPECLQSLESPPFSHTLESHCLRLATTSFGRHVGVQQR